MSPAAAFVAEVDTARILRRADAAAAAQPTSVLDAVAPIGDGDPHAFTSMADYFWPDPGDPDARYVARDGHSYPGVFNAHREALMEMRDATSALAAAYRLTGDPAYATTAAAWWSRFFVDKANRMAPHLEQAQIAVGHGEADWGVGLIDTLHLVEVPLAVDVLGDALDPQVRDGVVAWFADYLRWFLDSAKGRDEGEAINNHGVAYWVQAAAFAHLVGDQATIAEAARRFESIVERQMAVDGSFPLETARTKPYAYSIFQLDLLAQLCQLVSTPKRDLWHHVGPDGRSIRRAVGHLAPFLAEKDSWPLPADVDAWDQWPVRAPSLLLAGAALDEPRWLDLWRALPPCGDDFEIRRNNPVTQPVLWLL